MPDGPTYGDLEKWNGKHQLACLEIEHLRAEIKRLLDRNKALAKANRSALANKAWIKDAGIKRLLAANAELLAALKAYADWCAPENETTGDPALIRIRQQIRAAIAKAEDRK